MRSESDSVPAAKPLPKCARSSTAGAAQEASGAARPHFARREVSPGGRWAGAAPSPSCASWNMGTELPRFGIPGTNETSSPLPRLERPPCPWPLWANGGAIPARARRGVSGRRGPSASGRHRRRRHAAGRGAHPAGLGTDRARSHRTRSLRGRSGAEREARDRRQRWRFLPGWTPARCRSQPAVHPRNARTWRWHVGKRGSSRSHPAHASPKRLDLRR